MRIQGGTGAAVSNHKHQHSGHVFSLNSDSYLSCQIGARSAQSLHTSNHELSLTTCKRGGSGLWEDQDGYQARGV